MSIKIIRKNKATEMTSKLMKENSDLSKLNYSSYEDNSIDFDNPTLYPTFRKKKPKRGPKHKAATRNLSIENKWQKRSPKVAKAEESLMRIEDEFRRSRDCLDYYFHE